MMPRFTHQVPWLHLPPFAFLDFQATTAMLASRLAMGLRRLAPRQGLAAPRRLLCTPAATPPPLPPPLAAEPGVVAHIMKQLGSEVTTGLSKSSWRSLRPAGAPEAAASADHAPGHRGPPQARLEPEADQLAGHITLVLHTGDDVHRVAGQALRLLRRVLQLVPGALRRVRRHEPRS